MAVDLFCGAGGAGYGLLAAGFQTVVGVDIADHSAQYPGEFIQADVTAGCPVDLSQADFVWASPPCQKFSVARDKAKGEEPPDLIPLTRRLLAKARMSAIENLDSDLTGLRPDIQLDGPRLGNRRIIRRRRIEIAGFAAFTPPKPGLSEYPDHADFIAKRAVTVTKSGSVSSRLCREWEERGIVKSVHRLLMLDAMGIPADDWTREQVGEAVPPAYSEYVARFALDKIRREG